MVHVRIGSNEQELSWEAWEARVAEGRVPPEALVRFDPVTEGAWVPAAELEMYRHLASSGRAAFLQASARAGPPVFTALLVGVQVRLWWLARLPDVADVVGTRLTKWTAPTLEDGEVWRVVSMGFVHVDPAHALMNLVWLAYTSYHLERTLGWRHVAWLYLASVTVGSLFSMVGAPDVPSLGASGGVFGLIAAAVVFGFARPELLPDRHRRVFGFALVPYLVLMLASGVANEGTDNWAHLGGLLTGGALAWAADPPGLERRHGWTTRWHAATVTVLAAVLVLLAVLGPRIEPLRDEVDARRARLPTRAAAAVPAAFRVPEEIAHVVPVGWVPGRTAAGDGGWVSPLAARTWSVRLHEVVPPPTPESVLDAWVREAATRGWTAALGPLTPSQVGGRPGVEARGTLTGPETLDVVWRAAIRGTHVVSEVWQVEPDRAARLAPLHARLHAGVTWRDPPALQDALDALAAHPDRLDARRTLAELRAELGEPDEALRLQRRLVADLPASRRDHEALLTTLAWYPDAADDRDALLDGALGAGLGSRVDTAVANVLVAAGEGAAADGLLEVLWALSPGERTVARARRARGLSTDLDDGGRPRTLDPGGPWADAVAGATAAARARGHAALDDGRAVAAARDAARARLAAEVAAAIAGGADPEAPLAGLARGHAPVDGTRAELEQELAGDAPPPWWHPALPDRAALQDRLATPAVAPR